MALYIYINVSPLKLAHIEGQVSLAWQMGILWLVGHKNNVQQNHQITTAWLTCRKGTKNTIATTATTTTATTTTNSNN